MPINTRLKIPTLEWMDAECQRAEVPATGFISIRENDTQEVTSLFSKTGWLEREKHGRDHQIQSGRHPEAQLWVILGSCCQQEEMEEMWKSVTD